MEKKNENLLKNLKRCVILIQEQDKKFIGLAFVSTILLSLFPIGSLLIMQSIINNIQVESLQLKNIAILITLYIFVDIWQTIVEAVWKQYNLRFSQKFNLYIDTVIQRKIQNLNLSDYENSDIYDQLQLAQSQNSTQLLDTIKQLIQFAGSISGILSHVIILFSFKAWLIAFIVILPIIKYIFNNKLNQKQYDIITQRITESRKIWYWNYLMVSGHYFKELTIYKLFDFFIHKYRKSTEAFNLQDIKLSKKRNIIISALTIIEIIVNGFLFSYIIYFGVTGKILIGNIITYTRSIVSTKSGFENTLNIISSIKQSSLYIDLFFQFIDLPAESINTMKLINIDRIDSIRVCNLNFKYKNKNEYTIKNMNFELKRNQLNVIVGENGAGKTTLAKILLGFYNNYEGEIFVNNINLKNVDKASYMAKIATVFQDFIKYEATVQENIGYGNLDAIEDTEKIEHIQNLFKSNFLPLNAQIGNWFDEGTQISMGQWQKIALSRAFLKDADFYILDEPNASLDPKSEYEISQLYEKILKNKIGIIIAHKFNNFTFHADSILVIENGEIKEQGTHEELVNAKGKYHELFYLQANL